eukprot:8253420-Pyramimonas_sp.AAC.2
MRGRSGRRRRGSGVGGATMGRKLIRVRCHAALEPAALSLARSAATKPWEEDDEGGGRNGREGEGGARMGWERRRD